MFRENVLVNDDVIDRISKTMVPVAINYESVSRSIETANATVSYTRNAHNTPT